MDAAGAVGSCRWIRRRTDFTHALCRPQRLRLRNSPLRERPSSCRLLEPTRRLLQRRLDHHAFELLDRARERLVHRDADLCAIGFDRRRGTPRGLNLRRECLSRRGLGRRRTGVNVVSESASATRLRQGSGAASCAASPATDRAAGTPAIRIPD